MSHCKNSSREYAYPVLVNIQGGNAKILVLKLLSELNTLIFGLLSDSFLTHRYAPPRISSSADKPTKKALRYQISPELMRREIRYSGSDRGFGYYGIFDIFIRY